MLLVTTMKCTCVSCRQFPRFRFQIYIRVHRAPCASSLLTKSLPLTPGPHRRHRATRAPCHPTTKGGINHWHNHDQLRFALSRVYLAEAHFAIGACSNRPKRSTPGLWRPRMTTGTRPAMTFAGSSEVDANYAVRSTIHSFVILG